MTLLEVAKIVKPHGLSGEVVVSLITNRVERLEPGSVLSVMIATGGRLPVIDGCAVQSLVVSTARPHQGRFLVRFDAVSGIDNAEALRGIQLGAEPLVDDDALFVHDLIGKRVIDTAGIDRGVVTALEMNPASDLLVLEGRHYVPVRFVVSNGDHIVIDPPEGLFS